MEEVKGIEEEYKDDGVKIRIRQKNFSAPQYLSETIRHKINELMFHVLICQYHKMGDSFVLTTEQHEQIEKLVRSYYCRVEKMETKSSVEIYPIPKALSLVSNASNSVIEQSQQFSARLSVRKIAVANGSIEIHLIKQVKSIPVCYCTEEAFNQYSLRKMWRSFHRRLLLRKKVLSISMMIDTLNCVMVGRLSSSVGHRLPSSMRKQTRN